MPKPLKDIIWKDGYAFIYFPGYHRQREKCYAKRADLILEAKIGRKLLPNEIAYHKDRNKANDRPDNLEVKDKQKHASDHMKETSREHWKSIPTCRTCPHKVAFKIINGKRYFLDLCRSHLKNPKWSFCQCGETKVKKSIAICFTCKCGIKIHSITQGLRHYNCLTSEEKTTLLGV